MEGRVANANWLFQSSDSRCRFHSRNRGRVPVVTVVGLPVARLVLGIKELPETLNYKTSAGTVGVNAVTRSDPHKAKSVDRVAN